MADSSAITTADIERLRESIGGDVIGPGDGAYDDARTLYFTGFDRRPAVIVKPATTDDVVTTVDFAREHGVGVAVRSGGHSVAGHGGADGAVVIDLSLLKDIDIDAPNRTAWAQSGLTAKEYTLAAGEYGLVTGFGDTGTVGIGGISLGGGIGFLARKFGMTIDDVLAAELVTADGRVLQVDADQHPDLFWALRGGGGNFGVVTKLQYRLHELPVVYGGMLALPAEAATLMAWVEAASAAPEELSAILNVMPAELLGPMLPGEHHGPVLVALLCYAGPAAAGAAAMEPFRVAEPLAEMLGEMPMAGLFLDQEDEPPYVQIQTVFRDAVTRADTELLMERAQDAPGVAGMVQMRVLGGAMARVPADATAFAHRSGRVMVTIGSFHLTAEEAVECSAWVDEVIGNLSDAEHPAYVAFLSDTSPASVRQAYPPSTYARLQQAKTVYDPTNLFRYNHNIPPA